MIKSKFENKQIKLSKEAEAKKSSFLKKQAIEKAKKIEPVREKWVPSPVVKANPKAKSKIIKKEDVVELPNSFSKADQLGKK